MENIATLPDTRSNYLPAHEIAVYERTRIGESMPLTRLHGEAERIAQQSIYGYVKTSRESMTSQYIEPPLDAETIQSTAEEFVERTTGLPVEGPLLWMEHLRSGALEADGLMDTRDGAVFMADCMKHVLPSYRSMTLRSTAVHEKAHRSALSSRKLVATRMLNDQNGYDYGFGFSYGLQKIKQENINGEYIPVEQGQFFEEAFAEETATRWREEAIPEHKYLSTFTSITQNGITLPMRYYDYPYELPHEERNTAHRMIAAYAAHGLQLLSEHAGEDIYQVMIDSRHPETALNAKRDIIKTVNAVQPGLYQQLRRLPYTEAAFRDGLIAIQNTVTN